MNPERQEPSVQSFAGDSWELHIDAKEASAAEQVIEKRLIDLGWDEIEASQFGLAFQEALVNAVLHGNKNDPAKKVGVELRLTPEEIEATITDEGGVKVDPFKIPDPTNGDGLMKTNGRGVALIRELCDEVSYDAGKVVMIKRRKKAEV